MLIIPLSRPGFVSMTIPMYLAETSPPRLRGTLTVVNNLFITGGQMIAGLVAGGFSGVDQGWRSVIRRTRMLLLMILHRYMLGLAALPAIVQFIGFLFLPESPRYLVSKGRVHEARAVLVRIRDTENVDHELSAIKVSTSDEPYSLPHLSVCLGELYQANAVFLEHVWGSLGEKVASSGFDCGLHVAGEDASNLNVKH